MPSEYSEANLQVLDEMTYRERVDAQKRRNPCLTGLADFLARSEWPRESRLAALDFVRGTKLPTYSDLNASNLDGRLQHICQADPVNTLSEEHLGQLLIVEDISPDLVQKLGDHLDVDPWFFASYVHSSWRTTKSNTPQTCFLPSREKSQNFVPLYYHKPLSFIGPKPDRDGFLRNTNQCRKIVLIHTRRPYVGLSQQACAIFLTENASPWTGKNSA